MCKQLCKQVRKNPLISSTNDILSDNVFVAVVGVLQLLALQPWYQYYNFFFQSDDVVMDLTKLFQCSLMEEFKDIMSNSVKSMSVDSTSEWWAQRTRLDTKVKVKSWSTFNGLILSL